MKYLRIVVQLLNTPKNQEFRNNFSAKARNEGKSMSKIIRSLVQMYMDDLTKQIVEPKEDVLMKGPNEVQQPTPPVFKPEDY